MYATGKGVKKDLKQADSLFWYGCDYYGHMKSCRYKAPDGGAGGESHPGDLYIDSLRIKICRYSIS
jgi:hypothetical protein